jgi:hypothetical protein
MAELQFTERRELKSPFSLIYRRLPQGFFRSGLDRLAAMDSQLTP